MADNSKPGYMHPLSDYAHEMFEMFVQKQWLKEIDRQINAVNRSINKARKAKQRVDKGRFVLQKLIDEYNTRYHDSLCAKEGKRPYAENGGEDDA